MPIAENFPEGLEPTGKISLDDGNFHIMWGPGKKTNTDGSQAEVFADADVVAAYAARGEEQVPLTPRGTCSSPLAAYAATTSASANTSACEPSVFVFLPGPHIIWKLPSSRLIFPVGSRPSGKFSAIGITKFS